MGCDFCGACTRTALYVECVRHKACSVCFHLEQVRRRAGKSCHLCLREDAERTRRTTAWAPSDQEQGTVTHKSSESGPLTFIEQEDDDLGGMNDDIENMLSPSVLPPRDRYSQSTNGEKGIAGEDEASPSVGSGTNYPQDPGAENEHKPHSLGKNNIIFCPYPKRKPRQHAIFPTVQLSQPPTDKETDKTETGPKKQLAGNECEVQVQNKNQVSHGNPPAAGRRQTEENIANVSSGGSAAESGALSSSSCEDQSDYGIRSFPGGNLLVAPSKVSLQEVSLSRMGISNEHLYSDNISIYSIDDEDLHPSGLDKKVSIIDLQTPTLGSLPRVQCRRVDRPAPPRATKSEQTVGAEEGADEQLAGAGIDCSDHHLLAYGNANEDLLKQQTALLADWAKKQGGVQQQHHHQDKNKVKKSPPKKDVGLALGTSDGDASPEKGCAEKESPPRSKSDKEKQNKTLGDHSSKDIYDDSPAETETNSREPHMVALRMAEKRRDLEMFGTEGLPYPDEFWS